MDDTERAKLELEIRDLRQRLDEALQQLGEAVKLLETIKNMV